MPFDFNQMVDAAAKQDEERVNAQMTSFMGVLVRQVDKLDDPDAKVAFIVALIEAAKNGGQHVAEERKPPAGLPSGNPPAEPPAISPEEQQFLELIRQRFGGDLNGAATLIRDAARLEADKERISAELRATKDELTALQNAIDGDKEALNAELRSARQKINTDSQAHDQVRAELDGMTRERDMWRQRFNQLEDKFNDPNELPDEVLNLFAQIGDNASEKGGMLNNGRFAQTKIPIDQLSELGKRVFKVE